MTPGPAAVPRRPVTSVTGRWQLHVVLAGLGLLAALLLRAPVIAVLVTPSALLVAAALTWRAGPPPRVEVAIAATQLLSEDRTRATVTVHAAERTALAVDVGVRGALRTDDPTATLVTVAPGDPAVLELDLAAGRWGAATVGPVVLRWWSPGGLVEASWTGDATASVRVLPHAPAARSLVRPRATHAAHGAQGSRDSGEGTEFADLRPFAPGDRARDVSPRVSARRGQPWVVRRHPDRRTDVVLLLDAYDPHELDDVFAAARSLARGHLQARDRVGVTTMTGVLRWLPPGEGARHEHRIAAALVDARLAHSWVRPAVEQLPPRVLPPGALVLGVTPGTDPRLADTAVELRLRGWDTAVLVVTPQAAATGDPVADAAGRLLALERRTVRDRLQGHGVPTVGWDPATPVDTALAELASWRRRAAHR